MDGCIDDPDLPLASIFRLWPRTVEAFLDRQMLCPGCLIAPFHTVLDACIEYDLDEPVFRADLNRMTGFEEPK